MADQKTIKDLEADCERLRQEYATEMGHLSKYASMECLNVREENVAPDGLAGAVLQRSLSIYHAWVQADKALRIARR